MNISNYRNPHYNADGTVDLDITTDTLGVIPITIDLTGDDQTPHIIKIKQWLTTNANLIAAYVAPPAPDPIYTSRFTSLEFLDRFTQAEQETIAAATASSVQVKLYYDKLLAADFIDVIDPLTIAGIDALIALGLLDSGRKASVLKQELLS